MAIGQEEHYQLMRERVERLRSALVEIDQEIDEILDSDELQIDSAAGLALERIQDIILLTGVHNAN